MSGQVIVRTAAKNTRKLIGSHSLLFQRCMQTALRNLVAVLAAGVSCVGVRNFVTVVPLNGGKPSNGSGDAPVKKGVAHSREWVLNFLTSQLASTRRKGLGLFQEYFLPLAGECSALAAQKAEVRVCKTRCAHLVARSICHSNITCNNSGRGHDLGKALPRSHSADLGTSPTVFEPPATYGS